MLPVDASILDVAVCSDVLCMFALVDPEAPRLPRVFDVFATGEIFQRDERRYVGTGHERNASHAWHVFEVGMPNA